MCGIIGYVGWRPATPIIIQGLHDLEYRGYDSAGLAVLSRMDDGDDFFIAKREGKIARLEEVLQRTPGPAGTAGIGHTRWATHGRPSDRNSHPHEGARGAVVVAHNGIVENFTALREELSERGAPFASETDTETIAHLLGGEVEAGRSLLEALAAACARLEGSQAIVAMSRDEPGAIAAARIGNAGGIVIGIGEGENFVASDLAAVLPHTRRVAFLGDGQFALITSGSVRAFDREGVEIELEVREVPLDPAAALKGGYAHFMLKEIFEQPEALADTAQSLTTLSPPALLLDSLGSVLARPDEIRRVVLIGMGTSLHAAMVGRLYIEEIAGIPAEYANASEFRFRRQLDPGGTLVVSVSQSGETVDVLEAMAVAKAAGSRLITICNVEGSQSTRIADGSIYIRAGLERGVASTKCFTGAMAALYGLALALADATVRLDRNALESKLQGFLHIPMVVAELLEEPEQFRSLARELAPAGNMLFLGRGLGFPTAMEGALKMKEVSYIHAEGYAAGEMKHGPISLVEPSFPTVAVATRHANREKMVSNVKQVQARGGPVLALLTEGDEELKSLVWRSIEIPDVPPEFEPIVATVPLQLLAYYTALERGCDVDQPRNLAKTVTVE